MSKDCKNNQEDKINKTKDELKTKKALIKKYSKPKADNSTDKISTNLNLIKSEIDSLEVKLNETNISPPVSRESLAMSPKREIAKTQKNKTLNSCNFWQADTQIIISLVKNGEINIHQLNSDGISILAVASAAGEIELVKCLLEKGSIPDYHGKRNDFSPLMEAVINSQPEIVQLLIEYGANIDKLTNDSLSSLYLGCSYGHAKIVNILVAAGAKLDLPPGEKGHTPLMEAVNCGHSEIVKIIMDKNPNLLKSNIIENNEKNETQLTESTNSKHSILNMACFRGHFEIVKYILQKSSSIGDNFTNDELSHALLEACIDGHADIAQLLIGLGCPVNFVEESYESPLILASNNGHVDLVKLLLDKGANVNATNEEGVTALMEASREGHLKLVQELIYRGADVNIQIIDTGDTALSMASSCGWYDIVVKLAESGANIEHALNYSLIEASIFGHLNIVTYLVSIGADVNYISPFSFDTPLIVACENGNLEIVQYLIQNNATLENSRKDKHSLLMAASSGGHLEIVRFLINLDVDINKKDPENHHTALSLACLNGHINIVKILLQYGADPYHTLKDNSTILIQACKGGELSIVNLLLESYYLLKNNISKITNPSNFLQSTLDQDNFLKTLSSNKRIDIIRSSNISTESSKALSLALASMPVSKFSNICNCDSITPNRDCGHLKSCLAGLDSSFIQNFGSIEKEEKVSQISNINISTSIQDVVETLEIIEKSTTEKIDSNLPVDVINVDEKYYCLSSSTNSQLKINKKNLLKTVTYKTSPLVYINMFNETNRETALTIGCLSGHEEIVKLLINKGANIEHRDKRGYTPLMICSQTGNIKLCKCLINIGAIIDAYCDKNKDTSLTIATNNNRLDIVRLLVEKGANIQHQTFNDQTPLIISLKNGNKQILQYLLDKGANINTIYQGQTPLMIATISEHTNIVRILLERGADATYENNKNTALTLACSYGKTEIVSLLLEKKVNVEQRSKNGFTPLMEAANIGNIEIATFLIKAGADVNAAPAPNTRETPLLIAADKGYNQVVNVLLKHKANIEFKNKKSCTALWIASNNGFLETVKILDNYGACLDTVDGRNISAVIAALRNGHFDVVQYLAKKVTRFPSDNDCKKFLNSTISKDKVILVHVYFLHFYSSNRQNFFNLVSTCTKVIMEAKAKQELEAQKAAIDLIKMETQEKEKKTSSSKKRDKKKKRKAKAAENVNQIKKEEPPPSLQKIEPFKTSKIPKTNKQPCLNEKKETKEIEVNLSDSEDWKQMSRKPSAMKPDTSRRIVKTQIPANLVSRLIGKGGSSINNIREKTNTVIDIDTTRKTPTGDCTITIKGQIKEIRSVLCIITTIINDPERSTISILNDLENVKKTAEPASYVNVTLTRDNRMILEKPTAASQKPVISIPEIAPAQETVKYILPHQRSIKNDEDSKRSITNKECLTPKVSTSTHSNVVMWSIDSEQTNSKALQSSSDTTLTNSIVYPSAITSQSKNINLCPGSGKPTQPASTLQNSSCPIWDALYNGKKKIGVMFDKNLWMETSSQAQPFPQSVYNTLK
ncbi:hypothetical protein HZS_1980, partial [Henneguya salminicola]